METKHLDLKSVIEQVGKEKNINPDILIGALESAMLSAARKNLGPLADLEARYNADIGEVEVYEFKKIVKDVHNPSLEIAFEAATRLDPELTQDALGEDLGIKVDSSEFGRIAAQNAKQIIVQKVREAERSLVYDEYKGRKDELVTGIVRRFERGNIIVDLGRSEAIIPTREQILKENIRAGDRIVAYVLDVLEETKGSQIILSRVHPNLVVKLFEQEVPEIADGIVMIESASREPGFRTKIAVRSKDSDVDPVGACVGMKGARVQAVIQELKGEKIDIVPFHQDEARFVCNALAPAEISRVLVNEGEHTMRIVVPDDQLSLAIGRRGQNVRLAAELTGWKIDIFSESSAARDREEAALSLLAITPLNEIQIQTLYNHGFKRAEDIARADIELLKSLPGMAESSVIDELKQGAQRLLEQGKLSPSRIKAAKLLKLCDLPETPLSKLELSEENMHALNEAFYCDLTDLVLDTPNHVSTVTGFSMEQSRQMIESAKSILGV
ncbi:MAG: transcription termination/antitermination protein NusA [Myxococcaceae bacterium]|nr:transcription termination/antitermination protein NusA [Myxococcaceae bacterium]MBH2006408.1 transcription termination/antitermination protein NusA [Myxococcaceae bacterium]